MKYEFSDESTEKTPSKNVQLSSEIWSLTGVTEDGSDSREEEVEVDLGQVDKIKDDVQRSDFGLVYVVEVLLGKVGEGGIPQNDSHQHDTTQGSDGLRFLEEPGHVLLAQSINRQSLRVTTLVVDVTKIQLVDWGQSLPTTTRGEVNVASSVVEHPDSDSDTKLTASADQQVDLAGIKKLSSWVDANVFWASSVDNQNLPGGNILNGTNEVGERDGDRGKFEGRGGVGREDRAKEGRQPGRVLLDQRDDIDDTSGRSISRKFYWFSGVLVVDIEVERGENVLDDSKVRVSACVEDDVEGFKTRSLEPSPCGGESSGSGGIQSNQPIVDAKLGR